MSSLSQEVQAEKEGGSKSEPGAPPPFGGSAANEKGRPLRRKENEEGTVIRTPSFKEEGSAVSTL